MWTRVVAWICRFRHNARHRSTKRVGSLSAKEVEEALDMLYRRSQKQYFSKEIQKLENHQDLPHKSPLAPVCPYLDENGVLRVGGRLQNSELAVAATHPVILHRKSQLARLLAEQIHQRALHAGPATTLSLLSYGHSIIGAKRLVKSVSRACITCRRSYACNAGQKMAPLPACRTTPSPPFQLVGIDFAGPLLCKRGHTRKPVIVKAYVCVFVCMAVKSVHLELVADLTTESFLACFKRFAARRGLPTTVYSDNGTNFVGAQRELKAAFDLLQDPSLHTFAADRGIDWVFSPGRAPHFGGLYNSS